MYGTQPAFLGQFEIGETTIITDETWTYLKVPTKVVDFLFLLLRLRRGGTCTPDEENPYFTFMFCIFLRSFSAAIESLTLTSGSVEDMLLAGQATDLDWNVVLRMWRRITQARRLLRLPRARSVKKTALKRMTDFDDVTFQEQFRFTKTEFLVILSNMEDQNGTDLTDESGLPVMILRIGSRKRDYIRCWSDSRSWFC
jgi:hypothetical protein